MKILLALLLLFIPTQVPLDPVRVSVKSFEEKDRDLEASFKTDLRKLGYVAVVSEDSTKHFEILVGSAPAGCDKLSAVMFVMGKRGNSLYVYSGDSYEVLTRHLIEKLEKEHFKQKTGG